MSRRSRSLIYRDDSLSVTEKRPPPLSALPAVLLRKLSRIERAEVG